MNKYSVGELIYKKRKEKNLTQTQLGEMLGVSNKAVSKWETGESFPEFSAIQPLCEILGLSADELIYGKENENFKHIDNDFMQDETVSQNKTDFTAPAYKPKEQSAAAKAFEKRFFAGLAINIFLCILAVGVFFLSQYLGLDLFYALCIMMTMCAIAVYFFVHLGMKYDAYNKGRCDEYISKISLHTWTLPLGVAMCVISPCIIFLFTANGMQEEMKFLMLSLFFIWLAFAVIIIVFSGMYVAKANKTYDYGKNAKIETWQDKACGAIMSSATIIYFILGFCFDLWHPGWVVFPVFGIICGILNTVSKRDDK